MTDLSQLPFLLKLIDDTSPQVRAKVAAALRELGPDARQEVEALQIALTPERQALLDKILPAVTFKGERNPWLYWMSLEDDYTRLEAALSLLAEWQMGPDYPARLTDLLDELAQDFWDSGHLPNSETLSAFLFTYKGFEGAPPDSFHLSRHSNLLSVIETRRGLPISLACIFMLVGKRLGLEIYGCNFPGHFLARAREGDRDLVFDCFNGGRLLDKGEVASLYKAIPHEIRTPTPAVTMIARVLSNLVVAFDYEEDAPKKEFALTLLGELHEAMRE